MSMRANRDELVQKGILLPDSSLDVVDSSIEGRCHLFCFGVICLCGLLARVNNYAK
jgi:hypothetical protein